MPAGLSRTASAAAISLTLKRVLAGLVAAIGISAVAAFGVQYWQVGRFQISTDDAYVQADSIIIAPRVAGYIAEVLVGDNQPVKAGQVLARIDDRDLKAAARSGDRRSLGRGEQGQQHRRAVGAAAIDDSTGHGAARLG